jgi:serine/threonine protein phosphatase PrpC
MKLEAAACTDVGLRREANEDSFAMATSLGLYLVADGMGGHNAGRVASEVAAERAVASVDALSGSELGPAAKLRRAVADANDEIRRRSAEEKGLSGMGTTVAALLVSNGRVALAHVGDSRVYLVRSGAIRQLTEDHSIVGDLIRQQKISEADAREHPHRHVLTRALGVAPEASPDVAELTPLSGDTFVLCSDGLTGHLHETDIRDHVAGDCSLQQKCEALVETANRRGGLDNITALLVRFS